MNFNIFNLFNPTTSKTIDLPQPPTTEQRFVERVVDAVTSNNLPQMRKEIVFYSELLGTETVEYLMGEDVPLMLETVMVPRYLAMMLDGADLIATVQDLLAEVSKTLIEAGLVLGEDFSYDASSYARTPFLRLTPAAYATASDQYTEGSWKQCVPFLQVVS